MTRVEISDRKCKDCGSDLWIDHRAQTYGCEECGAAWSMERLDDWPDTNEMPPIQFDFSEYFDVR